MDGPWGLDYWKSDDWKVVQERLDVEYGTLTGFNPSRVLLFDNLRSLRPEGVRVVIVGQDPYPDKRFATGHAFSIPEKYERSDFPRTLRTLFKELSEDLAIEMPVNGNLERWAEQGVLLWNAIPTCRTGVSKSHDWREYHNLTVEVFRRILSDGSGCVFAFLGAIPQRFVETVGQDNPNFPVITTGHPSPRGNINSKTPFSGSRMFSTINSKLTSIGLSPIDWRLDARGKFTGSSEVAGHVHLRKSNRVLPNETGSYLGPVHDKRGVLIRK